MNNAFPTLDDQSSDAAATRFPGRSADVVRRHLIKRRRVYLAQAGAYVLGTLTLLIYAHAGTISGIIPSLFFLCGITIVGFFTALSETNFNDRFEDDSLAIFQVSAHILLQIGFLVAAPQIGYAFLGVLFLIFAFGSLQMPPQQIAMTWGITAIGVTAVFMIGQEPIGMSMTRPSERFAANLAFVLTIGQCAFVGLYSNFLRAALYKRSTELKAAYKRIEEIAEIDDLTGSLNRRSIMLVLDEEIARARRSKTSLSVALIDLDWFKRINDTFGHPTGDEVLRTFSITMFANIRAIDKFGRYGGEEFLLVLPDTSDERAFQMLDRQRSIVSQLDWSAFSDGLQVTISAGIATLGVKETSDTLLARADKALYAAKENGRNRIANA